MRRILWVLAPFIVLTVIGAVTYFLPKAFNGSVRSVSVPSAQIGFVNLSRVKTEAQAMRHFRELIERQYKIFHEEILSKEKKLQAEYEEIRKLEKDTTETTKDLKAKKDNLDRQISELDKILRSRKESLNKSFAQIVEEIEQTIREIVNNVAKRRTLNLVFNATILDASVVLYGGPELDITDEVLEELNHRLPTVHLPS
ncbi:OmpH family outer membrane protein [Candidatus Odyssella thessalonicensis]|uniref:OmpH family outer membrane protein n=1 Tax=Candidatus Odyssella thessalonicensis TaxID=84647 RepID=UPI000225ABA9|nr:OmpH family outer membrane protein [Candidatus Odyssella thessalonicensis]